MAKKKLAEPIREAANIIIYHMGQEQPMCIRYADLKLAMKDFDKLLEAADKAKPIVLNSPAMTVVLRHPQNLTACYLVDIEMNSFLLTDTQKRSNAMMQIP